MAFHACPRETQVAAAPVGTAAAPVDRPLVCAINHEKDRERDGRTTVIVMQPFAYESASTGVWVWVPATYVTDFASIPRVGRWMIPPFGRHAIAAVVHDWLYSVGEPGQRGYADEMFSEALKELGVDPIRRGVMHAAVTGFGAGGYDRAAETWSKSFMDWRTGEWLRPPAEREAFFRDGEPDVIERIRNQPPINCAP